ncbi:hypothetical protein EGT74_12220 [Chitinophaga lutea]|uniref:Uncharacterized protein n=1 Tax=Chitinophaga lutea TaxID=2488634 RepID=A0A3N4QE41_9BACT|nr:hypothetical protein EGT74_12220 [Chitinophaga lutea]
MVSVAIERRGKHKTPIKKTIHRDIRGENTWLFFFQKQENATITTAFGNSQTARRVGRKAAIFRK